jgi:CRP-like cAMP-binding protein
VGEIHEHEIFGAMAALTQSSRTATVVANTDCMLMVVPGDQFIELVKSQPRTCLALFENMAHKILALNQRLVDVHQLKNTH